MLFGSKYQLQMKNTFCDPRITETSKTLCIFIHDTAKGLKNMCDIEILTPLLKVDMYFLYINIYAMLSTVFTIFIDLFAMYNKMGN